MVQYNLSELDSLCVCVCVYIAFRWDAVPEVSPAHSPEADPGRLWLQSRVHLAKRGGGEHPQGAPRG